MKKLIISLVIIALVVVGVVIYSNRSSEPSPRVALAQCLATKGTKFYGAYWCPHCQNQKLAFGSRATRELPYVECAIYPTEVDNIAQQVLEQYKAGIYIGGYTKQLDAAKAAGTLDAWEPTQTEACVVAEVASYPTWNIKGIMHTGEITLEKLAELSGCTYDNK